MTSLTRLQKHRLLKEVEREPGLATTQLAKLISANPKVVYDVLRRWARRGEVYSTRLNTGRGKKVAVHWYVVPEDEDSPADACAISIDDADLAWMAHYRQRHSQRQEPRHE